MSQVITFDFLHVTGINGFGVACLNFGEATACCRGEQNIQLFTTASPYQACQASQSVQHSALCLYQLAPIDTHSRQNVDRPASTDRRKQQQQSTWDTQWSCISQPRESAARCPTPMFSKCGTPSSLTSRACQNLCRPLMTFLASLRKISRHES